MGFGEYRMAKGQPPTVWNREQVLATIRGISVEGSLPGRVLARSLRRRVTGSAADCNGHPLAGAPVRLERQSGRRWVRAASGTTSVTGTFSVPARKSGTYRAVVGAKRSMPVRVK